MEWLGGMLNQVWPFVERSIFIASFLFAAISLRQNTRERRLQNLLRFTERHQDVVKGILAEPRILDASVGAVPPTQQEVHSVNFLLLHLQGAFEAHRDGMYRLPEHIEEDIRLLFSYPIPRAVWERIKGAHNARFVAFVDAAIDSVDADATDR